MKLFRWRRQREEELDAEIRNHLDAAIRDRIARGEAPDEARTNALREFGNVGLVKEVTREMWGWASLERLLQDLRFGLRMLRKNPGFSLIAVLTLALGIGATTAIFSVVYAVVLRPLPFGDSERLVAIWTQTPQSDRLPMAAANHRDLKAQNTVFEDISILRGNASYNLTGEGEPELLQAARVPANLFSMLRVMPALGRAFTDEETQPGRDQVVILSDALWRRRYGGDANIVGKTIRLENVVYTVVGVMGTEFRYPTREVQIWTPLTINPADFQMRTGFSHLAVARLKPGVTLEQAQTEVNVIAARLARQYPNVNKDVRFTLTPLRRDIANVAQRPLLVLLGAALGLLLIGCCNLVNLLLARALTRSRETAVRAALGATPTRLLLQSAGELMPLLTLGVLLGVLAAREGIKLFLPWLPSTLPRVEEIEINLPVMLFSGGLLLLAAALVLLLPLLQARRIDLVATLREDARTSAGLGSKTTIRNLLVVGQVALTVMLLTGAGLLIRTFAALKDVNPGFRSQGVVSFRLAIPRNKYDGDDKVAAFCQRILEQVRALPGVEAAGMVNRLPLAGASGLSTIEFERIGQEPGSLDATDDTITTSDYFRAMNIPVLQGRSFAEQDNMHAPLVVVLDQQVARRAWPDENPIGKRVRSGPTSPWAEVVGIVGHIRHESLESDQRWQIYWNYLQRARDRMTLMVRTSGDARSLVYPVLGAIKAVDQDQPVFAVRTMTEVLDQSLALRWFNTVMITLFAGSSLLLAMIGIYGVIAWTVRQRTREIGVRLALGAQRGAVLTLVLQNGLKLTSAGIVLGLVGSLGLVRLLRSMLFVVGPTDPLTFAIVPVLIILAALLACWIPAWRATKVDPLVALRQE